MSDLTVYQNTIGDDCVVWTDENGQMNSMLKSAYDEMIEQQANADKGTIS